MRQILISPTASPEEPDAWLCDLVPYSCQNPKQAQAIARAYTPIAPQFQLPLVTVPPVPCPLVNTQRQHDILAEIQQADPQLVILLGDAPIRWFLSAFANQWHTLADFGKTHQEYGNVHTIAIGERVYGVLPVVHPRQAAKLGAHSSVWANLHDAWAHHTASKIAIEICRS